ncbi:TPA_asm: hypothetical protein vir556_00020 [dsDNA virus vir556]|nr:TPA_asm: hypothetical protein vir556_00020 [dsDNA virus vir556]
MNQILILSEDRAPRVQDRKAWDAEIDRRKKEMQEYKGEQ